ncbi:MAG: DUF1963 domain-containing protein [Maricaulaceae bacterium]
MFRNKEAAKAVLERYCDDYDLAAEDYSDLLLGSLLPVIGFASIESEGEGDSATYFGGCPILPRGMEWPIRPAVAELEALSAAGGSTHAPHLKRYGGQDFPFEFAAQIDCAVIADLGGRADLGEGFPATGRLLFFYDVPLGPWRNGGQACRVIWDDTPLADCALPSAPKAFEDMIAFERAELLDGPNTYSLSREQLLECVPKFVHPKCAPRPEAVLKFLSANTLDYRSNTKLAAALEAGDDLEYMYGDLMYEKGAEHLGHQMFGAPSPEQDDPRYEAAHIKSGLPSYSEAGENWPSVFAELESLAADWHLLLQLSLTDLMQDKLMEGMVYFLIHKDDLAVQNFDSVMAIYQQT